MSDQLLDTTARYDGARKVFALGHANEPMTTMRATVAHLAWWLDWRTGNRKAVRPIQEAGR
jgi:hypothetical protein